MVLPAETDKPAPPAGGASTTYEPIGGKAEPPAWFFTPEPTPNPAFVADGPAVIAKPNKASDILNATVDAEMKNAPKQNADEAFSVALMLGRGKELESQGRYFEAWANYRDLLREHPGDPRGWSAVNAFYAQRLIERARKLESQKRYFEAANLYRDVVTRDAGAAGAWWGLGEIFYKYQKKDQALYCFEKVLYLKPQTRGLKAWMKDYRAKP